MRELLTLGFSPCPNDTFIFHALVHGRVALPGLDFQPVLEDVETLNRLACDGALDVTKVSFGALPYLLEEYALLRSGGALGYGCGPLIVAREPLTSLRGVRIAIPGRMTTANLLLRLHAPDADPGVELSYDRIMPAVAAGEFDAGLIIHESRFTFAGHGLRQIVDLGAWWEEATGSPIPLGAIVARRSLGEQIPRIERAIRDSLAFAFASPDASAGYIREHAQELDPAISRSHIELYVNDFSLDLGRQGERAIEELSRRGRAARLIPESAESPFPG